MPLKYNSHFYDDTVCDQTCLPWNDVGVVEEANLAVSLSCRCWSSNLKIGVNTPITTFGVVETFSAQFQPLENITWTTDNPRKPRHILPRHELKRIWQNMQREIVGETGRGGNGQIVASPFQAHNFPGTQVLFLKNSGGIIRIQARQKPKSLIKSNPTKSPAPQNSRSKSLSP